MASGASGRLGRWALVANRSRDGLPAAGPLANFADGAGKIALGSRSGQSIPLALAPSGRASSAVRRGRATLARAQATAGTTRRLLERLFRRYRETAQARNS